MPAKPRLDGEMIRPFGGMIDTITASLPLQERDFGFITAESHLGKLPDTSSFYSMGYGRIRLNDLCDAMIVAGPVCDYTLVTLIGNFIDSTNFENSVIQSRPYNFNASWTIRSMNDSLRQWHLENQQYIGKIRATCNDNHKH
jgi:hypothetical protein